MLVLSRKINEQIVIIVDGKELGSINVVDIRGDKVRLGLTFPKEVGVHRDEVWAAMQRQEQQGQNRDGQELRGGL